MQSKEFLLVIPKMDLEEYKKQLHKKLVSSYFSSSNTVSGNQILDFTPEKQINLMLLYLLMEEWEIEIEKNKSSYFDFNSEEVKNALKSYMNVLSKNILLKEVDFNPLLKKAIDYTFQLVENPESFVIINKLEQHIPKLKKYIQYHKAYFEGDLDYEITSKLEIVKDNLKPIFNFKEETTFSENIELETPSIHEKLMPTDPQLTTLADKLGENIAPPESTLKDQKIESIKNAISINQRFVLSNSLFDGDTERYMNVIEHLDNCESEEEAKNELKKLLMNNYEKEETNQLRTLIEQKFNLAAK